MFGLPDHFWSCPMINISRKTGGGKEYVLVSVFALGLPRVVAKKKNFKQDWQKKACHPKQCMIEGRNDVMMHLFWHHSLILDSLIILITIKLTTLYRTDRCGGSWCAWWRWRQCHIHRTATTQRKKKERRSLTRVFQVKLSCACLRGVSM